MRDCRGLAVWVMVGWLAAGCGHGERSRRESVPRWALSESPRAQIGVVEGDSTYELYGAISSVRLPDGRIVVANTGTGELRCYDSGGRFLWKTGGRGGGPGEFPELMRVHAWHGDSLVAYLAAGYRIAVFDDRGRFGRTMPVDSGQPGRGVLDAWTARRFFVDGAWEPVRREAARRTVERMPVPRDSVGYRFARVADDGEIWVREPLEGTGEWRHWTVFDTTGTVVAVVSTPRRLDIHEIGPDFVLGRWRDANDVEFVRLYGLTRGTERTRVPAWVAGAPPPPPALTPERQAALLDALRSSLRNVVTAEERHYADHGTYTDDARALEWDVPEGFTLDIISAGTRGWLGVAVSRDLDMVCGMAVGAQTPPGWLEGVPTCG